jgi:hypothetical protein
MMPSNVKIIKVGDSEVGIIDLMKILREVYLLGLEDELPLKEELVRRAREKNYISEKGLDLYAEALWREYRSFAEAQWPVKKAQKKEVKQKENKITSLFKRLFGSAKKL